MTKIIRTKNLVQYVNDAGQLHREDGPAIEYADGYKQYYLNGKEYPFEEWERVRKLQAFV
jgi:hypothetical protein